MKGIVEERAVELGEYIVEHKTTVRAAAGKFGVSKSTVHKDVAQRLKYIDPQLYRKVKVDVAQRLKYIDPQLYRKVKVVLDYNKAQRHIRGGIATRLKYQKCADARSQGTAN